MRGAPGSLSYTGCPATQSLVMKYRPQTILASAASTLGSSLSNLTTKAGGCCLRREGAGHALGVDCERPLTPRPGVEPHAAPRGERERSLPREGTDAALARSARRGGDPHDIERRLSPPVAPRGGMLPGAWLTAARLPAPACPRARARQPQKNKNRGAGAGRGRLR